MGGTDVGASFAGSSSAGASNSGAVEQRGGGNYGGVSFGAGSYVTGKPAETATKGNTNWFTIGIIAALIFGGFWLWKEI